MVKQIGAALLALQLLLLSGFLPEECCAAERGDLKGACAAHQSSVSDHCAMGQQSQAQTHQCCATQQETSLSCLCQGGRSNQQVLALTHKRISRPTARELPAEAATWRRLAPAGDQRLSVFHARRAHAPPGAGFRLNLRI